MVHAIDEKAARTVIDPSALPNAGSSGADGAISWSKDPSTGEVKVVQGEESWLKRVYNDISHYVSDFLEALREGLVTITRFAIRVVGKVVNILFEIGGKILKFVVKTLGVLVKR